MSWVDLVRGLGTILIIMVVAGGIAYVGDRVGHQVGRKRLTLFGIRPRYTSTIVAVGTGMVIALIVTLGAILASAQVKTAFFRLNSINAQIVELQARQHELEQKVSTGELVLPPDTLMVPFYGTLRSSDSPQQRFQALVAYYSSVVQYINKAYTPLGLKAYKAPPDVDKRLQIIGNSPLVQSTLQQGNVIVMAVSDQNLYRNDQLHFSLQPLPDRRLVVRGQEIAQLKIPGGSGASVNIALAELQTYVTSTLRAAPIYLPKYLATNVQMLQIYPDPGQIQKTISKPGTYYMTAYAAEDIYPHTGGIPIVIALTSSNPR